MLNKSLYFVAMIAFTIPFMAHSEQLRDPTEPFDVGSVIQVKDGFILSSILNSNGRKLAVINGEILTVGDKIFGAKLLEITDNKVVLFREKKLIPLYLFNEQIRQD